jgi:plastocyanin
MNETWSRRATIGLMGLTFLIGIETAGDRSDAQTEQVMEVVIRNNTFVAKQAPLKLNLPVRIVVNNQDSIRHDFGSAIFHNTQTQIEHDGVIAYGSTVGGVFLDGGRSVTIHFTLQRPGQYEFKCSIHPNMKGEILLMSVGAV